MKIGQKFKSQSKIQDEPVGYEYCGQLTDGQHYIKALSGNPIEDCAVDEKWFENRKITLIG